MTKKLSELALLVPEAKILGDDVSIGGIEHDSRKVTTGNLFVCMEGAHVDGHNFISQAKARGAVAILTARQNFTPPEGLSALVVPDMLNALAVIVPYFYDYPARAMRVVGVTGTNGKTTTTYMLREIFRGAGLSVGLIGTIQILIGDDSLPNPNTTPNVIDFRRHGGFKPRACRAPSCGRRVRHGDFYELDARSLGLPRHNGKLFAGKGEAVRRGVTSRTQAE